MGYRAVWVLADLVPTPEVVGAVEEAAESHGVAPVRVVVEQHHVILEFDAPDQKTAFRWANAIKVDAGGLLSARFGPFEGSIWRPGLFVVPVQGP